MMTTVLRSSSKRRFLVPALVAACAAVAAVLLLGLGGPSPDPDGLEPPTGVPGRVLFDGDFSRDLTVWPRKIHPERISILDDPILGARRKVARFTVYESDIGPTDNPRAQIESPPTLESGDEFWVGWATLLPEDLPALPSGGWLTLQSIYGSPAQDTGPLGTRLVGEELRFERNATYDYDVPWRMPLIRGRWIDFAYHVKLSAEAGEGFVELYLNTGAGWRQQILLGRQRLHMRTLDASNGSGPNSFRVNNYRKSGIFDVATLYHAAPKVGTSFDAVAPDSYGD